MATSPEEMRVPSPSEFSSGVLPPRPRRSYVHEQTAGSLLRESWSLYRSNIPTITVCYFVPAFPAQLLYTVGVTYKLQWLVALTLPIMIIASLIAFAAVTVVCSDICLGNTPNIRRAYGKLLERRLWLQLLLTGLVLSVLFLVSFLLLIVPGVILAVRLQFCSVVIILERLSGIQAIRRCLTLTKGQFWRLAGIMLLALVLMYGAMMLALIPVVIGGFLAGMSGAAEVLTKSGLLPQLSLLSQALFEAAAMSLLYPLYFIMVLLLYYDLRVRKEAYDVVMLAEDLRR